METYIAKTFFGLEELLADELRHLGADKVEVLKRAVQFQCDKPLLYRANMQLRTALRILMPIAEGEVRHAKDLYTLARSVNWSFYFTNNRTFAVDSVLNQHPAFNHSNFVSLTVKDAIVDQFRDLKGDRPNVDKQFPDIQIHVHIFKEYCTLLLDTSGESLHRRGYRRTKHEAPLNEILAAALVKLSGWQVGDLLLDPMCGSGTIAIEAAMQGMNIAANALRAKFGFMYWRDYDAQVWQQVQQEVLAQARTTPISPIILARDKSIDAVRNAEENARRAGVADAISFTAGDFFRQPAPHFDGNKTLVFNPPYNERLKIEDTLQFYKSISDCLKNEYQGFTAHVLSPSPEASKAIRLSTSKKWTLYNGSIACQYLKYELYAGSKREK